MKSKLEPLPSSKIRGFFRNLDDNRRDLIVRRPINNRRRTIQKTEQLRYLWSREKKTYRLFSNEDLLAPDFSNFSALPAHDRFKRDSIDFLPEDSSPAHPHLKRASPDNLKPAVQRVEKVARIINGIYIQQGVITASIPSDELISELLFFGSVTPSGIAKLDSKKMEEAVNIVRDLPTTFALTTDTEKAEKAFGLVKQMKDMLNGVDSVSKWNMDEFKEEIKRLETDGVNDNVILTSISATIAWIQNIKSAKDASQKSLTDLKGGLEKLKDTISTFNDSRPHWNFNNFENAVDGIQPLTKASEHADFYIKNRQSILISDDGEKSYSDFVRSVSAKMTRFQGVESSLQEVMEVASTRNKRSRQRNLRHTHGLSSGSSDVSQMMKDVNDPWIKKVLKTDNVEIAFKQFNEFESLLKSIEQSLDIDGEKASKIYQLMEYGRQAVQMTNMDQLKTGLQKMKTCTGQSANIDLTEYNKFKASLEGIDKKIVELMGKIEEFSQVLSTPNLSEMCDEFISISGGNDSKAAGEALKNHANLDTLNGIISNIDKIASAVKDMNTNLKSDAATVRSQLDTFNPVLGPLTKISSEVFDCLNHKDVQSVLKSFDGIQSFRSLKDDSVFITGIEHALETANQVIGVQKGLKTLEKTIDSMRGFKSDETSALSKLDSVSTHSRVIGSAVEGVANMMNALENKTIIGEILQNMNATNASKHLLDDNRDVKNLDSLLKMKPFIEKMMESLVKFSKEASDSDSLILLDHSSLFQQASSVSGINGSSLADISSSVGKLIEKETDPDNKKNLETLKSSLDAADSMGLDFALYQKSFKESKDSLDAIDTFFRVIPEKLELPNDPIKIALLVVAAIVVLILFVTLLMFFCCRPTLIRLIRFILCIARRQRKMRLGLLTKFINALDLGMQKKQSKDVHMVNQFNFDICNEELYNFIRSQFNMAKGMKEKGEYVKPHPEDRPGSPKILKAHQVALKGYGKRFADDHIYSINYQLPNGKEMVAVQAPIADPPTETPKAGKLWWMIKQLKAKNVVMLCPFSVEREQVPCEIKYVPKKDAAKAGLPKYETSQMGKATHLNPTLLLEEGAAAPELLKHRKYHASKFFPTKTGETMEIDDIKLKCISKDPATDDEVPFCVLRIEVRIPGEKKFVVNFQWLRYWDDPKYTGRSMQEVMGDFNPDADPMLRIIKVIEGSKTPTVVISDDGVERAGVLACVEMFLDQLKNKETFEFYKGVTEVQKYSPNGIVSVQELYHASFITLEYLVEDLHIKDKTLIEKKNRLVEIFKEFTVAHFANEEKLMEEKKEEVTEDEKLAKRRHWRITEIV
uniref:Tyrosine-protein phosphatase domain-containing protein n=1 Tax=Caenorhabditis tropicalis TaxID=1561998 RepID=A0A1I7UTB9_9PELO